MKLCSLIAVLLCGLLIACGMVAPACAIPPLHEAARDGDIDAVKRIVAENPSSLDERDDRGNEAIHWAVANDHNVVLQYLLDSGVSPDVPKTEAARQDSQEGWTPLHQAAAGGDIECLKILLRYHPDLLARDQNDQTPLHIAVWNNQLEATKLLLEAGTPVNVTRKDRVIPLEIASYFGHTDIVKYLIEKGADVNWHVYDGNTPLHQAVRNGHVDVMRILVDSGADIEARREDGQTPLHVAAAAGRQWETNFLLSMGADPEAKMNDGTTPLALAKRSNQGGTAGILQTYLNARKEMTALIDARHLNQASMPTKNLVETTIYQNEFDEETPGEEWSTTTTGAFAGPLKLSGIPNTGKHFLGEFGDQNLRLTLTKLPPHSTVTVVVTLLTINTWDGGGIEGGTGPDIWEARVEGGPMLFRTTFANRNEDWQHIPLQAFPGEYTRESHPERTGALARDVLHIGATNDNPTGEPDAVYRLKFSFAHNKSILMLNFQGKNLEELSNESWGIRNIEVRVGHVAGAGKPVASGGTSTHKHHP
jgi:ankyrin repeat protein